MSTSLVCRHLCWCVCVPDCDSMGLFILAVLWALSAVSIRGNRGGRGQGIQIPGRPNGLGLKQRLCTRKVRVSCISSGEPSASAETCCRRWITLCWPGWSSTLHCSVVDAAANRPNELMPILPMSSSGRLALTWGWSWSLWWRCGCWGNDSVLWTKPLIHTTPESYQSTFSRRLRPPRGTTDHLIISSTSGNQTVYILSLTKEGRLTIQTLRKNWSISCAILYFQHLVQYSFCNSSWCYLFQCHC